MKKLTNDGGLTARGALVVALLGGVVAYHLVSGAVLGRRLWRDVVIADVIPLYPVLPAAA